MATNPPSSLNPQSQSRLFSLPAELRQHIFSLALGCPPIPLANIVLGPSGERRLTLVTRGVGGPNVEVIRAQQLLSLPLTCKRAHAEALPLLYSTNAFTFGDPDVLPAFSQGAHVPWVRKLDFSWYRGKAPVLRLEPVGRFRKLFQRKRPGMERKWDETWRAIARFEHLYQLQVTITVPYTWTGEWKYREEELLSPLQGIPTKGTQAELLLTWEKVGSPGHNVEDFLDGWSISRVPWGAGFDRFPET